MTNLMKNTFTHIIYHIVIQLLFINTSYSKTELNFQKHSLTISATSKLSYVQQRIAILTTLPCQNDMSKVVIRTAQTTVNKLSK